MKRDPFIVIIISIAVLSAAGRLPVMAAGFADISSDVYLYGPDFSGAETDTEKITGKTEVIHETQINRTVIIRPDEEAVGNLIGSGVMGDLAAPEGRGQAFPDTGDESRIEISIAAAALSVTIMTIIILLKRRRSKNEKCNSGKDSRNSEGINSSKSRNYCRNGSNHGIISGAGICRKHIGR